MSNLYPYTSYNRNASLLSRQSGSVNINSSTGGGGTILPDGTNYSDYLFWNSNTNAWDVDDSKIHLGQNAGQTNQGLNTIAIGINAGNNNQNSGSIAIGNSAGFIEQQEQSIAIGVNAGSQNQDQSSIAIGSSAGNYYQGSSATAIGGGSGSQSQGQNAIAIGTTAGFFEQQQQSIAIGYFSGNQNQDQNSIAIGYFSGYQQQGQNSISIGTSAGQQQQNAYSIAIGSNAGYNQQKGNSISIGNRAGQQQQEINSIAIGVNAGQQQQQENSIAIGYFSGYTQQGQRSVAIGDSSGKFNQNENSIAIGTSAGFEYQSSGSISIGIQAGQSTQGLNSIAIGNSSGYQNQGQNSIAIGTFAGYQNQPNNSIILNASGTVLNGNNMNSFYVTPIRNQTGPSQLYYNENTNEITYRKNIWNESPTGPTGSAYTLANIGIGTQDTSTYNLNVNQGVINVYGTGTNAFGYSINNTLAFSGTVTPGEIGCEVSLIPASDNTHSLGKDGNRWTAVYAVNGAIQTSDPSLKDMEPLPYGLNEIEQIQPILYNWKDDKDKKKHYGINASEVQSILPEMIYDTVPKQVNYSELIPVLINAVKELSVRVKQLERNA